jgi:hypothetical protein
MEAPQSFETSVIIYQLTRQTLHQVRPDLPFEIFLLVFLLVNCVVLCIVCVNCVSLCIVCVNYVALRIVCVNCVVLCIVCVIVLFYVLFV